MALYDTFTKGVVAKEFTAHRKDDFLKLVKSLDHEGIKTFLLIIKFHELKDMPEAHTTIPYSGKSDEAGITFDLDKLPLLLQNILYKFMEMYAKNKQVEMERHMVSL